MVSRSERFTSPQVLVASAQNRPLEVDLVRSYLRDIGRVPLLSHEQEITLGRQVQELMSLELLESELQTNTGSKPSLEDLALSAGISPL